MTEYKCGDCFHADLCKKSKMIVGFSRDNPAYCGMFLNSADVSHVRHGRWKCHGDCGVTECSACGWSIEEYVGDYAYCPNCGAKMDEEVNE